MFRFLDCNQQILIKRTIFIFSPSRKRKHKNSKHNNTNQTNQNNLPAASSTHSSDNKHDFQNKSQYWSEVAEKKRTIGIVEPRVIPRISKKPLGTERPEEKNNKSPNPLEKGSKRQLSEPLLSAPSNHFPGQKSPVTSKTCPESPNFPATFLGTNGLRNKKKRLKLKQQRTNRQEQNSELESSSSSSSSDSSSESSSSFESSESSGDEEQAETDEPEMKPIKVANCRRIIRGKSRENRIPAKKNKRTSFSEELALIRLQRHQKEAQEITENTPLNKASHSVTREVDPKLTNFSLKTPDDQWIYCEIRGCSFWTRKPERMIRHRQCHRPDTKYYKCPDCSLRFYSLAKMLKHDRKVHTGVKDYECRVCEAEVTDIQIHMRVRLLFSFCKYFYQMTHSTFWGFKTQFLM